jgi:DNA-binding NarL/FixJ family response regulator
MTANNKTQTQGHITQGHIHVFLVDDHPPIREAICGQLEHAMDIDVVGEAETAGQGLRQIEELHPDVVITDMSQRDGHGLDLIQNVKSRFEDVQVIVYSRYEEIVYAERAIRAGASGYVMKTSATDVLVGAIRTAHDGEVYLSRKMSSRILCRISRGEPAERSFSIDELTDRELTVFQMLGEGYSMTEIQDRLSLARKTVETYRRRAKEKLGVDSVSKLLQYALQWVSAGGDKRAMLQKHGTLKEESTPEEDASQKEGTLQEEDTL